MAKFNFSNFKESLNGSTKRAKNTQVKRSDSSRYNKENAQLLQIKI